MGNLSEVHIYSVWVWSTLYLLQAMGPCDPPHKWIPCISWLHTLSSLEGLERFSTNFEMLSCSDVDFLHPFQCRIGDILTWTLMWYWSRKIMIVAEIAYSFPSCLRRNNLVAEKYRRLEMLECQCWSMTQSDHLAVYQAQLRPISYEAHKVMSELTHNIKRHYWQNKQRLPPTLLNSVRKERQDQENYHEKESEINSLVWPIKIRNSVKSIFATRYPSTRLPKPLDDSSR